MIPEAIAQGISQYGMQTFDQSLYALLKKNMITYEEAIMRATNPEEFKLRLQGISSTSGLTQEQVEEFTFSGDRGSKDKEPAPEETSEPVEDFPFDLER